MSKKLIYVSFWTEDLEKLVQHLKETNWYPDEVAHMEEILNKSHVS